MKSLAITLRHFRRPAQAMATGLGVVAALWALILAWTEPNAVHVGMLTLLVLVSILQLPTMLHFRRRRPLPTASFAKSAKLAGGATASWQPDRESRDDGWLKEEIEWPLFNIKQLLDSSPDRESLEWLPQEVERLLDRLESAEASGHAVRSTQLGTFPFTELLKAVVSGQQAMLRATDQRVDVQLGHRREQVHCRRSSLFDALATLLSEACRRLPSGTTLNIRTKEICDRLSVVVFAKVAENLSQEVLARAQRSLQTEATELWGDVDGHWGFGLSLPLAPPHHRKVRERNGEGGHRRSAPPSRRQQPSSPLAEAAA